MKADVTITPAAPRTYAVPKAVSLIVTETLSTPSRAISDPTVTDLDLRIAKKLAMDERITADDAFDVCAGLSASASSELSFNLRGGQAGRDWAAKIVDGIRRDEIRMQDAALERVDYRPEEFYYFGLSDQAEPNLLRAIARLPIGSYDLEAAESLTASGGWESTLDSTLFLEEIADPVGTPLPTSLLASSVEAMTTGFRGIYLSATRPLCFLDNVPILASAIPPGMTEDSEFVYAIVDPTDTTAVVNLILIKPGPKVYIRSGGAWAFDQPTLDQLLSAAPPPIVELSGSAVDSVIQQVDASQAQQVAPDAQTGEATEGAALQEAPVEQDAGPKESTAVQRKKKSGPVGSDVKPKDPGAEHGGMPPREVVAAARVREAYESALTLTACMRLRDSDAAKESEVADLREVRLRAAAIRAAIALRERKRRYAEMLENVIVPIVAAPEALERLTPGQRRAEALRKYWVSGLGAVKVAWGVPGDFYRCVSHISKYMTPEQAKGYCAKAHHRATGFWPGNAPMEKALHEAKKGLKKSKKDLT